MAKGSGADTDYVIREVGKDRYEVAKFVYGCAQPTAVYTVTFNKLGQGKCDCAAAVYRGTGDGDKHVKMVRKWLQPTLT